MAKKNRIRYVCSVCAHEEAKWLGRCPFCGSWNTLEETSIESGGGGGPAAGIDRKTTARAQRLGNIEASAANRFSSGMEELDRVLGGGVIPGSSILIGGEPGIGKSTLMLQIAGAMQQNLSVLYVTGEESAGHIKHRAERIGIGSSSLQLLCENNVDAILRSANKLEPEILIIDSIQTLISPEAGNVPGTVNQLTYSCYEITDWCREHGAAVFLIAHVTKEGSIAGPKLVEHLVDTVLQFEHSGDEVRFLRPLKNRFGAVEEIGLFLMDGSGLHQLPNPASRFLARRGSELPPGIAVAAVYEGSRVLLVELQALTVPAKGGLSRIYSDRIDSRRVSRMAAVLEKHLSLRFSDQDIYVNIAGGLRIDEVGIDFPLALALYSARTDISVPPELAAAGEVTLAGELRSISHLERRRKAAVDLGYKNFFGPPNRKDSGSKGTLTLSTAVQQIFNPKGEG